MKFFETFSGNSQRAQSAFTRVDLLVVVVAIALLTLTLVPSMARTHVNSQGTRCLNNLRQITMAWAMYADDSDNKLAPHQGAFPPNFDYNAYPRWVAGNMRGGSIEPGIIDATNSALLVDEKYSVLGPYVRNPALFKCPADLSTWAGVPRVRSYSMNAAFGCTPNGTAYDSSHIVGHWLPSQPAGGPWRVYLKKSDLSGNRNPADLILLVDEHPDGINDAVFAFQMPLNPAATDWIDYPTIVHNNAANLSFADGHVETHLWQHPEVMPPLIWAADTVPGIAGQIHSAALNPDILWMAHHVTALGAGSPLSTYQP